MWGDQIDLFVVMEFDEPLRLHDLFGAVIREDPIEIERDAQILVFVVDERGCEHASCGDVQG